ncbi:MAG TPA: pyridoxamine 5'-phosphate oxidase [Gemmatimonadaceae bacterium]|nr:pyridoxamine 5'-phosphate oxidase [Gemmatimonadaceae bacterium]
MDSHALTDPIAVFKDAFARAQRVDRALLPEPSAMSLATVDANGSPSLRIVLLKGVDERGFVFYTNLESRKGRDLRSIPRAALCFYWPALDLQVRVEGSVTGVTDSEANEYFASRPRGSQIGAWASTQSAVMEAAGELDARVARHEKEFEGREVPRPDFWSGFRVTPERIEFWRNRANRLHDRTLYTRDGDRWKVETLYP